MSATYCTTWIDNKKSLQRMQTIVMSTNIVGIDAETTFTGVDFCTLCILQIATESEVFIIDTTVLDIQSFMTKLLSSEIMVVVHDAHFELRLFKRLFNALPRQWFDTLLAAKSIDSSTLSLKGLTTMYLDIEICKKEQQSSWLHRPLREEQIKYAAEDAHVLLDLQPILWRSLCEQRKKPVLLNSSNNFLAKSGEPSP